MSAENLVLYGALGVGAYWVYKTYMSTPAASTTAAAAAAVAAANPTAANLAAAAAAAAAVPATRYATATVPQVPLPTTTTIPYVAPTSLAGIYSAMAASVAVGSLMTADGWNFVMAANSTVTPPAPNLVWTFNDAFPRTSTMTLAQYWSLMEPYLVRQGMSGLGLFAGMGAFYKRGRR